MKLTEKQFNLFKEECLKWQDRFELHNWDLHFRWQESEDGRAGINTNLGNYIATAFLSREWDNYDTITDQGIKMVAKHEMIHLLIARLETVGKARYISEDEMTEADEELVRKLEYIIK